MFLLTSFVQGIASLSRNSKTKNNENKRNKPSNPEMLENVYIPKGVEVLTAVITEVVQLLQNKG